MSISVSALLLTGGVLSATAAPGGDAMGAMQVKVAKAGSFGEILATSHSQALYYWDKDTNGHPTCVGGCAAAWPPLLVAKGMMAPTHVMGAMGKFTVVMRPDGKHQLAYNGKPLYTFVQDKKPLQVLCDGVQGWHVVRIMAAH